MKTINEKNYAVDLYACSNAVLASERKVMLHTLAHKYKWKSLGSANFNKRYFRFGYVDSVIDPEFKGDSGYYYWTADSMRSDDYELINFNQAVDYLVIIDKTITKEVRIGSHKAVKHNATSIKIGCRQVFNKDILGLADMMQFYALQSVAFIDASGNNVYMTFKQIGQLINLMKGK